VMSIAVSGRGGDYGPSSFLRTRSTAPEQPPQVMVMLKLYVWSDIVCLIEDLLGGEQNRESDCRRKEVIRAECRLEVRL
jgi:hypothetical protein